MGGDFLNVLIQEECGGVYDVFFGSPREVLNWLAGYCRAGAISSVFVGPPDLEDPESYHEDYDLIITIEKKKVIV